ncbi:MAG: hypothetical protein ACR2QF_00375 [Geminicoccaceae bacterium]
MSVLKEVKSPTTDDEIIKRLDGYIRSAPENSRRFLITPVVASYILESYNDKNRSKKPEKIKLFSTYMKDDQWFLTGDTLKFSDEHRLADGQNRLFACVRAGAAFETHIVFGIPAKAFTFLDRGRPRSGGDALTVAGYSNTTVLSGAVRWLFLLDNNPRNRTILEPDKILELLQTKYQTAEESVSFARKVYNVYGLSVSQLTALHCAFCRKDQRAADEFFQCWAEGRHKGKTKSLALLQKRITTIKAASGGRINEVVQVALIIKAWNAMREGKGATQKNIDFNLDEDFPEIV